MNEKTTYQFVVRKTLPISTEREDRFMTLRDNKQDVFTVDIEAYEMVELMEHLWNIASRRNKNNV
jgi:hypothetical protein